MQKEDHGEHDHRGHRPEDALQVVLLLVRLAVLALDGVDETKDHEEDAHIEKLVEVVTALVLRKVPPLDQRRAEPNEERQEPHLKHLRRHTAR